MMFDPRLALGILLASCASSGWVGWKLRDAGFQAHLKREAQADAGRSRVLITTINQSEADTQRLRDTNEASKTRIREVVRTVYREIPKYVTDTQLERDVVARGGLPLGFVWGYNQAAGYSQLPLPPGNSASDPSGVSLSTLAAISAGNSEVCLQWARDLDAWDEWYSREAVRWSALTPVEGAEK
jgi:hypothetical protein